MINLVALRIFAEFYKGFCRYNGELLSEKIIYRKDKSIYG